MRRLRFWPQLALVLVLGVGNGGCILIPQIKKKNVELAVGGSTTAKFIVVTDLATLNTEAPVTLNSEFDLDKVLRDAGIDASKVKGIKVSGVSYSITKKDPAPSRTIAAGMITIRRNAGVPEPLVTAFGAAVGAESGYISIPLDARGVGVLNQALSDVLTGLQNRPATPPDVDFTFHLAGTNGSANGPTNTNFEFTIKVVVSIKGEIQVSVPS